jgi:hypothetical protein
MCASNSKNNIATEKLPNFHCCFWCKQGCEAALRRRDSQRSAVKRTTLKLLLGNLVSTAFEAITNPTHLPLSMLLPAPLQRAFFDRILGGRVAKLISSANIQAATWMHCRGKYEASIGMMIGQRCCFVSYTSRSRKWQLTFKHMTSFMSPLMFPLPGHHQLQASR